MARQTITAPPTGTNPSPTYSDNFWLKSIWVALTNAGATPAGSLGGNTIVIGNVASGVADSGAPVKTGGKYNSTPIVLTNGMRGDTQMDTAANTMVTLGTKIAGEDLTNDVQKVEQRFSYTHIAAGQAATTIKSGSGFLHSIVFNGAATATNVTTVYDNTAGSGAVIAIPAATVVTAPTTVIYDISFATGLTILTATANGSDMTVSWR